MTGAIQVRTICAGDLDAVAALTVELGYDVDVATVASRIERVHANPGHRILRAELGGTVVGLLHMFERPSIEKGFDLVVQSLVVQSTVRERGVGKELLAAAEDWAVAMGAEAVTLYSGAHRDGAHAFYSRLGYRRTGASDLFRKPVG